MKKNYLNPTHTYALQQYTYIYNFRMIQSVTRQFAEKMIRWHKKKKRRNFFLNFSLRETESSLMSCQKLFHIISIICEQ